MVWWKPWSICDKKIHTVTIAIVRDTSQMVKYLQNKYPFTPSIRVSLRQCVVSVITAVKQTDSDAWCKRALTAQK